MKKNKAVIRIKGYYFYVEFTQNDLLKKVRLIRKRRIMGNSVEIIKAIKSDLKVYLQGNRITFKRYKLDINGFTSFELNVFNVTKKIPWGKTLTYKEVAKRVGSPNSARAVGNALRKNAFHILIPCHRVVGIKGIGNYTAPGGEDTKKELLKIEMAGNR